MGDQNRNHASPVRYGKEDMKIFLEHRILYPYYWCEDLITIVLALGILVLGVHALISDAQEGVRWWTAEFWTMQLPTDPRSPSKGSLDSMESVASDDTARLSSKDLAKESTPLSSKHGTGK